MNTDKLEASFREGTWAIAATPAGKYIGQLWGIDHVEATADLGYFITHLGNPMYMRWAMEFSSNFIPRQVRDDSGAIMMAFDRQIQANCISRCWDVENLAITITPVDLIFFGCMGKEDAEFHRNLIRNGIKSAWANRLRDSKIISPYDPHTQEGNA